MGCSHSVLLAKGRIIDEDGMTTLLLPPLYPSAIQNDIQVDADMLALWKRFLQGKCATWHELVALGKSNRKTPAVYWSDDFKNRIVQNISTVHPFLAMELQSRPLKAYAPILCGIMEFCLLNVIGNVEDDDPDDSNHKSRTSFTRSCPQVDAHQRATRAKIAKHHCKWSIQDADYILVENAMMDSLRICLGKEFIPQFEVRLRYKYAMIKRMLQKDQRIFERGHLEEAHDLKEQAAARIQELQQSIVKESSSSAMDQPASPGRIQNRMLHYSAADMGHEFDPIKRSSKDLFASIQTDSSQELLHPEQHGTSLTCPQEENQEQPIPPSDLTTIASFRRPSSGL